MHVAYVPYISTSIHIPSDLVYRARPFLSLTRSWGQAVASDNRHWHWEYVPKHIGPTTNLTIQTFKIHFIVMLWLNLIFEDVLLIQPLHELLSKSKSWTWGPSQSRAFDLVKEELSKHVTLALYNPAAPAKISADASAYGLGVVLPQRSESTWKPVAFASHSITETERRYVQIEKEALATMWACEKFSDFVLGKQIMIETDHKPLVPLLEAKELDRLPSCILRFQGISHVCSPMLPNCKEEESLQ